MSRRDVVSVPSVPSVGELRAVVFDFDGLILDTETSTFDAVTALFEEHDTRLDPELWLSFLGSIDHPHWTEVLEDQLGRPVDRDELKRRRLETVTAVLAELAALPGVVQLIEELSGAGIAVGVASSSSAEWVHGHLGRLGLFDRFDSVSTGNEVERTKPAPDVYALACRRLGVSPRDSVAIEDSSNGCRAARAAGLAVVAVPLPFATSMDLSMADEVLDSVAELDVAALQRLVRERRAE